jgi:membrane protease YdiL (CAAX protease family)
VEQTGLNELAVAAMNIALVGVSIVVWSVMLGRYWDGQPLLPPRFASSKARIGWGAVALVLIHLSISISAVVKAGIDPPQMGAITVERLRTVLIGTLLASLITLPVLIVALLIEVHKKTELIRLGFRLDDVPRQCRDAIVWCAAAFLPVIFILLATSSLRNDEAVHPFLQLLMKTGFGMEMVLIFVTAVIVAPVLEELIYRVILQTWLTTWMSAPMAIVASSLTFAAVHGFPDAIALIPLALILGAVYHYRRSYLTIVLLHALFNLSNLIQLTIAKP